MVEERAITIVLDIRNMSPQQFDLYRMALERVIYEQVTQIAKFNLIRYVPWNYHIAVARNGVKWNIWKVRSKPLSVQASQGC